MVGEAPAGPRSVVNTAPWRHRAAMVCRWLPFTCLLACSAPPPLPPAARGLVDAGSEPPAGAVVWQRPQWQVGDRFVLAGGGGRFALQVVAVQQDHYELAAGAAVLRRDLDLGNLGEWTPAGEPRHVLLPADVRFHWPLWLGKRWSSEFVDRGAGSDVVVRADYVVEGLDVIAVPAGTFEALRIVRTARRVETGKDWLPRTQISWYAPAIGHEVRQLVGETMLELVETTRAR